jgi:hypothetical protein
MVTKLAKNQGPDLSRSLSGDSKVAEVINTRSITEVWIALGGPPPKRGRARAFFRDGDNPFAVSLKDSKGAWFDHRDGVGGGVLDLIQQVRGCDRHSAFCWLAELNGAPLDNHRLTLAERRQYARRLAAAKLERAEFILWKERILDGPKRERDRWWRIYHGSLRYLLDLGLDAPLSDVAATLHELAEARVEFWAGRVETLGKTPHSELLAMFRETKARAAA